MLGKNHLWSKAPDTDVTTWAISAELMECRENRKSWSSYQFAHNRVDCHPGYTPIVWCFCFFFFLNLTNIVSKDLILYVFVLDYAKVPSYRRQGWCFLWHFTLSDLSTDLTLSERTAWNALEIIDITWLCYELFPFSKV